MTRRRGRVRSTQHRSIRTRGWMGVIAQLIPPRWARNGAIYQCVTMQVRGGRSRISTELWRVSGGGVEHGGLDFIGARVGAGWRGRMHASTTAWYEEGPVRGRGWTRGGGRSGILLSRRGSLTPLGSGSVCLLRRQFTISTTEAGGVHTTATSSYRRGNNTHA